MNAIFSTPAAAASLRAVSRNTAQQSMPSTDPDGPTRCASWIAVSPNPQPTSSTLSPSRTFSDGNILAL